MKSTATPLTSGPELVPTLIDQLLFSGEIANDRIVVRVGHAHPSKACSQCDVVTNATSATALHDFAKRRRMVCLRCSQRYEKSIRMANLCSNSVTSSGERSATRHCLATGSMAIAHRDAFKTTPGDYSAGADAIESK